jgi:hypothetical protein
MSLVNATVQKSTPGGVGHMALKRLPEVPSPAGPWTHGAASTVVSLLTRGPLLGGHGHIDGTNAVSA